MIRFLPFILIPILIIAGLGYWRFGMTKQDPVTQEEVSAPAEVPRTLPTIISTPTADPAPAGASRVLDPRVAVLETAVTDLKARIAVLEKASPVPVSTSVSPQSTIYIPIGSAAGPWSNTDWSTLNEYEISLDPGNYPGYSGMILEVNFRLVDPSGTGSVRLYNTTDSSVVSSQLDTGSTGFSVKSSSVFKLASGQKTYKLQVKSSGSKELYIQSARIKVNF